jgi:MFS family permease
MSDRVILYATAFTRSLATGMIAVLLSAYLALLDFSSEAVGYVVASGLAGNAVALFVMTLAGDRIDRKRALIVLGALWAAGGALVLASTLPAAIAAAAALGMINGMGRDRGAALAIEQALLPGTTTDAGRTGAFAMYNALQDVGHALGALAAGVPALLARASSVSPLATHRAGVGAFVALAILCVVAYTRLSHTPVADRVHTALSPDTRRTLAKICALFALDGLGGGFLTTSLVTWFFFERFAASEGTVALLFFGARVANVVSHFGAAALARRIGLVRTMVFTHVPSSVLLVTVAIAPSFPVAAILFLAREGLVEMDVPTRQSYVMALVRPEERARASSVTNLVRMVVWAVSSLVGGVLMSRASIAAPLLVGAALKLTYDALLYLAFRRVHPPEERPA